MKAILMTRLDAAEKTHDLLKLYDALPADSRERLEADYSEIARVLGDHRHTLDRWRYFEASAGEDAMLALLKTERVSELGKAARVRTALGPRRLPAAQGGRRVFPGCVSCAG